MISSYLRDTRRRGVHGPGFQENPDNRWVFVLETDHSMERAGLKLKRARERLKLTYRDVEQASQKISAHHDNEEFTIALSRLADIENKGTLPSIYRIYTLCAIYRLDFQEVLRWYGVPFDELSADGLRIPLDETHLLHFSPGPTLTVPQVGAAAIDLNATTFLSHIIRRWGKLPLSFLNGLDLRQHRYGLIGMEDWSMYPLLHPGSLVAIDDNRRKIAAGGWTSEFDRPIYFLERRDGFACGWCTLSDGKLLVHSHPASNSGVQVYEFPHEIEVVGQVVGVAMLLDSRKRRRPATPPAKSPNQ